MYVDDSLDRQRFSQPNSKKINCIINLLVPNTIVQIYTYTYYYHFFQFFNSVIQHNLLLSLSMRKCLLHNDGACLRQTESHPSGNDTLDL